MKGFFKLINFFLTTLDADLDTSPTGTITVVDKTVDGYTLEDGEYKFYIIVDLPNKGAREIFRIWKVLGKDLYYDKRISPSGVYNHSKGTLIQINDISEVLNFFSKNLDVFGYTEEKTLLEVTTYGGSFKVHGSVVTANTTDITVTDEATTTIGLDFTDNAFKVVADEGTFVGVILCDVVAAGGEVTSITERRAVQLPNNLDTTYFLSTGGVMSLVNESIEAAKLKANSVTTVKILDANVTTAKIADNAITTAKILDANITTVKILDANITTAKIAANAITTAKILDANITTAKILDANITPSKLDATLTESIRKADLITDAGAGNLILHDDGTYKVIYTTNALVDDGDVALSKVWSSNKIDTSFVHIAGDETIGGNKTFSGDVVANSFSGDGSGLTDIYAEVESRYVKSLTSGAMLYGHTIEQPGEIDMISTYNAETPIRYGGNSVGQTFTIGNFPFFAATFIRWQIGSKTGSTTGAKYRFYIYDSPAKTTNLYTSGEYSQGSYTANTTFSVDISGLGLQPGVQYYAEFVKTVEYGSSYYFWMRYNNITDYNTEDMYINGVLTDNAHMALKVEYTYRDYDATAGYIPLRTANLDGEDPSKVYQYTGQGTYLGVAKGDLSGYSDPEVFFGGTISELYGDTVVGGIFTHPASELNRLKFLASKVGTGSNLDVEIYTLDGNGDLDTKIGGAVGVDATGLSTGYYGTVANTSTTSMTYVTLSTITADHDTYYRYSFDQRTSHSSYISSVKITINGYDIKQWDIQDTGFHNRKAAFFLRAGDEIKIMHKTTNNSYTSYVYNTVIEDIGEIMTVDLGSIVITPDTEYGFLIKGDGDATNHTTIGTQIDIAAAEETLWSNSTSYGNRNTETRTVGTIPGTGVKKVRMKAQFQNASYGRVYSYLRQNDVNILGPIGFGDANLSYAYDEIEGEVDFDAGAVTWYNVSQGDTDYGYSRNHSVVDLVKPDSGFTSSTGFIGAIRDNIGIYSKAESDEVRPLVNSVKAGILDVNETLEINQSYYIDPYNHLTTSDAVGNIYVGKSISSSSILLKDNNEELFGGTLSTISFYKSQTNYPEGTYNGTAVYLDKNVVGVYSYTMTHSYGNFTFYIQHSKDNVNWDNLSTQAFASSSSGEYAIKLEGGYYYRMQVVYTNGTTSNSQTTSMYFRFGN